MKVVIYIIGVVAVLVLLVLIGLQIKPRSFEPYLHSSKNLQTIPLPEGLPSPVELIFEKYMARSAVIDLLSFWRATCGLRISSLPLQVHIYRWRGIPTLH